MPLVKVVPYMVLHQKTHVPVSVNFLGSQMAFQHLVAYLCSNYTVWKFQNLSDTQILREISFWDFRIYKYCHFDIISAQKFDFDDF